MAAWGPRISPKLERNKSMKTRNFLAEHVYRCPQCGRFVLAEATSTFFDCSEKMPEEEMGGCAIAAFCDEMCADKFHGRAP